VAQSDKSKLLYCFEINIDPASNMFGTSPTSHGYISQRLKLHYLDWGNPNAPPLLLIHGGNVSTFKSR